MWEVPDDAAIVITHMHYRWEEIAALRRIYESGQVPVLILADGILEYRNIWEHPDLADGCIFQPVVGHKLATIGFGQTRAIESWGNVGKCETVGLPRLDSVKEGSPIRTEGAFRILIATATTPAFNQIQREAVVQSLAHLHKRLTTQPKVNGRDVEVVWRLTDGLDEEIGVDSKTEDELPRPALAEIIDGADAVIMTPSTMFLECALRKRPVAILDFHNTPHFVGAAWMINSPLHLNQTLIDLANPPAAKMMFQENVLRQQLRCDGSAADRMIELIATMVGEGQAAKEQGRAIEMPHRIISDETCGFSPVVSSYDLQQQYPENTVFQNQDIERLQLELNLAIARLDTAPSEANELGNFFDSMKAARDDLLVRIDDLVKRNADVMALYSDLQKRQKASLERIAELKGRLDKLNVRYKDLMERDKKLRLRIRELENPGGDRNDSAG